MLGCTLNRLELLLLTVNDSVWALSSLGPVRMLVANMFTDCAPASSLTVWSPPTTKLGTSLTAVTLIANVWAAEVSAPPLAVPPSSCNCTVTIAEPFALAAGV